MSKMNDAIITALEKGYKIDDEQNVIGIKGDKLSLMKTNKGYLFFHIRVNGEKIPVMLHRLIAYLKFGEETFKAECVRHLDNDKQNNHPDNISIGTLSENFNDNNSEIRNRMFKKFRKLTEEQVREIRAMLEQKKTIREISEKYSVSMGTIQQIKDGKTYKWIV